MKSLGLIRGGTILHLGVLSAASLLLCADAYPQNAKDSRAITIALSGNNATEIAGTLSGAAPGISVKALGAKLLLLTYTTDVPADNVSAITSAIHKLDGQPPELSSGRVVRLFNLHDASTIAPLLNKFPGVEAKNIGDDLILLSGGEPGREQNIDEAKRYLALLDSPRPEVSLNVWSVQISSKDRGTVDSEGDSVRHVVALYNQQLHDSLEQGWKYLAHRIAVNKDTFYNNTFRDYLTHRFTSPSSMMCPDKDDLCKNNLQKVVDGECSSQYCLGYTQAFSPLRPSLTNLLLTIAAAADPPNEAKNFVDCMESSAGCIDLLTAGSRRLLSRQQSDLHSHEGNSAQGADSDKAASPDISSKEVSDRDNSRDQCFERYKGVDTFDDCELKDFVALSQSGADGGKAQGLKFECFRQQLQDSVGEPGLKAELSTSRLGLLRSAIADFLFQYKFANQFPHEFVSYDYSKSAQILDSEFDPLLVAFNRDVGVFLRQLQAELECRPSGKASFRSNGIITIRTISNQKSTVVTKTANYFDATTAPSITDLVGATKDTSSGVGDVIAKQISPYQLQAIMAGLSAFKPVTSQIGRGMSLEVTPRSLLGASATELAVVLKSNEDGDSPKLLSADNSDKGPDAVNRVAQHEVTTNVRVEALKLFELSSFSATLSRGRKGIPLILPLVELPLVGSFARIPMPPGTVYHRSFAVISAVIVPTAADLANGITFSSDSKLDRCPAGAPSSECDPHDPMTWPEYHLGSVGSLSKPIRLFHTQMLACLASPDTKSCAKDLSLEKLLRNRGVSSLSEYVSPE